jgi:EPS-associated MarR family transcriptional regulator
MTLMNTRKQTLQEDTHFWMMRHLAENPSLSQRALAKELGISLGSVNFCLQALIEKGLLKAQNFSANPNKLNYTYLLTPKGLAEKTSLTARFLKRKLEEYEMLKQEVAQLQVAVDKTDVIDNGH